jgi:hypothetical protein
MSFDPRITYVERSGSVSREVRGRGAGLFRVGGSCRCWLHVEWPGLVSSRWADGARGNDCVHDDDEDDVAANVDDCAAAVVHAIGGKGRGVPNPPPPRGSTPAMAGRVQGASGARGYRPRVVREPARRCTSSSDGLPYTFLSAGRRGLRCSRVRRSGPDGWGPPAVGVRRMRLTRRGCYSGSSASSSYRSSCFTTSSGGGCARWRAELTGVGGMAGPVAGTQPCYPRSGSPQGSVPPC